MKLWFQKAKRIYKRTRKWLKKKHRYYLIMELNRKQAEYVEMNQDRILKSMAKLMKGK